MFGFFQIKNYISLTNLIMLGKDFGLGSAEPYYFKFIPTSIEKTGGSFSPDSQFKFVVFKGTLFSVTQASKNLRKERTSSPHNSKATELISMICNWTSTSPTTCPTEESTSPSSSCWSVKDKPKSDQWPSTPEKSSQATRKTKSASPLKTSLYPMIWDSTMSFLSTKQDLTWTVKSNSSRDKRNLQAARREKTQLTRILKSHPGSETWPKASIARRRFKKGPSSSRESLTLLSRRISEAKLCSLLPVSKLPPPTTKPEEKSQRPAARKELPTLLTERKKLLQENLELETPSRKSRHRLIEKSPSTFL